MTYVFFNDEVNFLYPSRLKHFVALVKTIILFYSNYMIIEQQIQDEQRIKIFKALADQTRLDIIKTLYFNQNRKELNCGEVGELCESSKSNTSYHFRTLKEAGLIKVRKDAQAKYVSLNLDTFDTYLPGFLKTL